MLRIRLRRVGKKKQPMYRIVVADSRAPRDGAFVESLGYYHPLNNPSTIVLNEERAKHWLDHGAQPSDRVAKLLKIQGIAEIPAKLATRIELGEQRKHEAQVEKAKAAKAASAEAPAAAAATAPAPEAAVEAPAEEPAAEAAAEEPVAEAPAEEPAAEAEQAAE
jgi:small subunit ribosomal protein S16